MRLATATESNAVSGAAALWAPGSRRSPQQAREALVARLQARRLEIEQAAFTRISSLSEMAGTADPQYREGLRAAVRAAIEYGLAAVELGEENSPPVPMALHSQARLAARNGVSLDTILRRYLAGYTLLGDYLIQEAEKSGLQGTALQSVMRGPAILFERLIATVTEEFNREAEKPARSVEERRAARVRSLLAGELLDTADFDYEFDAWHVGMLVAGEKGREAVREFAAALDRRTLIVCGDEATVWAWLGGRREFDRDEIGLVAQSGRQDRTSIAIGEPSAGLDGWRQTHRQARAALPIALRGPDTFARYSEVALLASILQDDLLRTSFHQLYLAPLEEERDGGEVLRQTLGAYFAAERNVSSAAITLGVSRQTVKNRLSVIEERLGRRLGACIVEMEAALRLNDFSDPVPEVNSSQTTGPIDCGNRLTNS